MKFNRSLAIILAFLLVFSFVLPLTAAERNEFEPRAVNLASSPTGVATIEADPARLSSPGYVNVTIKLRNLGSVNGGASVGDNGSPVFSKLSSFTRPTAGALSENPPDEDPVETTAPVPSFNPIFPPSPTTPPRSTRFTNIYISNSYGVTFETTDVYPGTVGLFRGTMMVYENMIGKPLAFAITWYDTATETTYHQNLALIIQHSDTAYLRVSRTVSTASAAIGDEVDFTYTVVNTGTRRLNNITLTDEKIGGSAPLFPAFSLAAGETKELVYTYTMKDVSVASKPIVTYVPEGSSMSLSASTSKITLGLVTAQLTKEVTVGSPTPEGVGFTIVLTNNGSQNLADLEVKTDLGETLASGFSLAIGESKIIEHFVDNPETVRNVIFYFKGTYDVNKEFSDNTTSYPVRPYINPRMLGLDFSAEIRKQLDSENNIGLSFTIKNTGKLAYNNITLTEKDLGYTIREIAELKPGTDQINFNADIKLDSPRELVFYLTALDPSGNEHTYEAYINAEYADLDSAVPNATPKANRSDSAESVDSDSQLNNQLGGLLKIWNILKVIFFITLAIVIILGAAELMLYVKSKRGNS